MGRSMWQDQKYLDTELELESQLLEARLKLNFLVMRST